jgi:hypothetical protein
MATNSYAYLYRFLNTLLLAVLIILAVTGVLMLYLDRQPWMYTVHRIIGFSLLFLAPWKGLIIFRSLQRGFKKNVRPLSGGGVIAAAGHIHINRDNTGVDVDVAVGPPQHFAPVADRLALDLGLAAPAAGGSPCMEALA